MDSMILHLVVAGLNSNASEAYIPSDSSRPRLVPPTSLYDMHLDEGLSLRRVELLPSLPACLKEAVDRTLQDEHIGMHSNEEGPIPAPRFRARRAIRDVTAVAACYESITLFATRVASALALHPAAYGRSSCIQFSQIHLTKLPTYSALNEEFGPTILGPYDEANPAKFSIPKHVWELLDDDTRFELRESKLRFPDLLAVWEMFLTSTEAEEGLKNMDDVARLREFPWIASHTVDLSPVSAGDLDVSPDAIDTAWGVTVSSFSSTPPAALKSQYDKESDGVRRAKVSPKSVQTREQMKSVGKRSTQVSSHERLTPWPTVSISSKIHDPPAHLLMSISMLQHAWARAVERDSTFIVFHCGSFERIGFRHRASQTLFLSDLIEPTKCENLRYGRLHVGLYIAIFEDLLDRARQLGAENSKKASLPKKRKREAPDPPKNTKRPRIRAAVAREMERRHEYRKTLKYAVSEEMKKRNLALLRATGDAHNATIELLASNGEVLSLPNVVVKIAFKKVQQDRLRNEFHIYEHLMSANVKSIPYVFGLFEDHESKAMALIMTNIGTCILDRLDKSKGWQSPWPLPSSEINAFAEALKSIHSAGVRHRDIRAENMVIGDDGAAYMIDFDRAVVNASERSRNCELEYMLGLLRADIPDLGEIIPHGTPRYEEE
ncbi:hypothetical protein H0H92_010807 [Tricholoma furcatifolium]|nr:hypothetical protein H0H92_010807 [Tricholoma furcatifolium]